MVATVAQEITTKLFVKNTEFMSSVNLFEFGKLKEN